MIEVLPLHRHLAHDHVVVGLAERCEPGRPKSSVKARYIYELVFGSWDTEEDCPVGMLNA